MGNKDYDKALVILQKTHDGDDLSPSDLKLLELYINGHLNEKGIQVLEKLYQSVAEGSYVKPWHLDVEHMTYDHDGYIYFKGQLVEHYSRKWGYSLDARRKLLKLQQYCLFLESRGEEIGAWPWAACGWTHQGKYAEAFAQSKQVELDNLLSYGAVLFSHIKVLSDGSHESFLLSGQLSEDDIRASDEFRDLVQYDKAEVDSSIEVSTYTYGKGLQAHASPEELGIIDLCFDYLKDKGLINPVSEGRYVSGRRAADLAGGDYRLRSDKDEYDR